MIDHEEYLNRSSNRLAELFCPYGFLDIKRACEVAIEVNENENWVFDQIDEFSRSCGTPYDKIDPVYCVYESILQEARNEITNLTGFDLCNDAKDGEIYTYGNFMCTSYDYKESAKEELKEALQKNKIKSDDLSEKGRWFLSEVGIDLDVK